MNSIVDQNLTPEMEEYIKLDVLDNLDSIRVSMGYLVPPWSSCITQEQMVRYSGLRKMLLPEDILRCEIIAERDTRREVIFRLVGHHQVRGRQPSIKN